jgi:hypothetical protein
VLTTRTSFLSRKLSNAQVTVRSSNDTTGSRFDNWLHACLKAFNVSG